MENTNHTNEARRCCPHCNHPLTLRDSIIIMHPTGFEAFVKVKLPDGTITFIEAGRVDPTFVEILD